jgi:hypothetical protein
MKPPPVAAPSATEEVGGVEESKGSLPECLTRLGSEGGGASCGAMPFPLTTSAKEGDGEAPTRRPREEELPSDNKGLKSSHSGSSSPAALAEDDGEKGWALGLSGGCGLHEEEGAPTEGTSLAATRRGGLGGEQERERAIPSHDRAE